MARSSTAVISWRQTRHPDRWRQHDNSKQDRYSDHRLDVHWRGYQFRHDLGCAGRRHLRQRRTDLLGRLHQQRRDDGNGRQRHRGHRRHDLLGRHRQPHRSHDLGGPQGHLRRQFCPVWFLQCRWRHNERRYDLVGASGIYVAGGSTFPGGISNSGTISAAQGNDVYINGGSIFLGGITNTGKMEGVRRQRYCVHRPLVLLRRQHRQRDRRHDLGKHQGHLRRRRQRFYRQHLQRRHHLGS